MNRTLSAQVWDWHAASRVRGCPIETVHLIVARVHLRLSHACLQLARDEVDVELASTVWECLPPRRCHSMRPIPPSTEKTMRLLAGCELTVEAREDCAVVAMLRPRSGEAQWLISESYELTPHERPTEFVDAFGNLCQRFVVRSGKMRIRAELEVETERDQAIAPWVAPSAAAHLPDHALQYLLPSRYCPSDRTFDQAQAIMDSAGPHYGQVGAIVDWIRTHIAYRYGASDASTDALGTMQSGAGVCRDYAHVGISLCRSLRIPARMVVGYLYGLEPMDLHAWFEAYLDGRWYTFDPTQSSPRGGRIVVAYGRDAADVAFLTSYGGLQTVEMQVWVGERTDDTPY